MRKLLMKWSTFHFVLAVASAYCFGDFTSWMRWVFLLSAVANSISAVLCAEIEALQAARAEIERTNRLFTEANLELIKRDALANGFEQ